MQSTQRTTSVEQQYPTESNEGMAESDPNVLMHFQYCKFAGKVKQGLVFWDNGSNVNLAERSLLIN